MNPFKKILNRQGSASEGSAQFAGLTTEEIFQRALHFSLFGQNEKSALALETCIQQESNRPEFYLQLARTYLALDRRDLSIQILKDLLLRPELEDRLQWGIARFLLSLLSPIDEPRDILKVYHKFNGKQMSQHELLEKVAQALIELRQWDEALKMCKTLKSLGYEHESYEAQALLGRVKSEFGTSSGAISGIKKLLKKFPSNSKIYSYYLDVSFKNQSPRERLALWNSFFISCPYESAERMEEFEKDLFDNDLFSEVLPIYTRVRQNIQTLPLSFYHFYVRALIREGQHETAITQSLDLVLSLKTDESIAFIVKEILPHLPPESNFPNRLTQVLKEIDHQK